MTEALGGRAGDRQPVGLALPRAATALERERMLVQRARGLPGRRGLREHRRRPGRAGLRRPQRGRRPGRRRARPRRRSSRSRSRFCTIDPREVVAARLRDARHRANVRRQRRASARGGAPVFTLGERHRGRREPDEVVAGEVAAAARPAEEEVYARAAHRAARLRGQERLRARGARRSRAGSTRRSWR